jgi:hypothetical protein
LGSLVIDALVRAIPVPQSRLPPSPIVHKSALLGSQAPRQFVGSASS